MWHLERYAPPLNGVFSTPRIGGARHSTAECSREYPIRDVHVWVAETRGVLAREVPGASEHKTTICTSMETGGEQNAVFVHACCGRNSPIISTLRRTRGCGRLAQLPSRPSR